MITKKYKAKDTSTKMTFIYTSCQIEKKKKFFLLNKIRIVEKERKRAAHPRCLNEQLFKMKFFFQ